MLQDDFLLKPSKYVIDNWILNLLPEYDIYFLKELPSDLDLNLCLPMPVNEYFDHPVYSQLEYVNAYELWRISNKANYAIIDFSNWFDDLSRANQKQVLLNQYELNRGLVVSLDWFYIDNKLLENNLIKNKVVMNRNLWESLSYQDKERFIYHYAQDWEDWNCKTVSNEIDMDIDLISIVNTFTIKEGINCLSTVLYCLTHQENILKQWVHEKTFLIALEQLGYKETRDNKIERNTVIVFKDDEKIIHAAYIVSEGLAINKSGQSKFNPIKLVDIDILIKEWNPLDYVIYRR
ncbi:hypothetical protein [uncultured Tissierella sp.]|uniref:hypothetical protein n=1 Tax=uncultured Tissierella sp. TaxID=448160 RepID=UPI0028043C22|nr:hypothetical protein [uncultured Tissierella sp.]MDU5080108.1 hypothetical protein [Bacillota bacterium]